MKNNSFFYKSALLLILAFISQTIVTAQDKSWKKFEHPFGFSIELPSQFEEGYLANSGIQWYTIDNDTEHFYVTVEYGGKSSMTLKQSFQSYAKEPNVSYKVLKDNWFVVSGIEDKTRLYYLKTILKSGNKYTLRICYPTDRKSEIDPLVGRIARSFK